MSDDDENDEFWPTYIASTPEEDRDFAGCGQGSAWGVLVVLAVLLLVWWLVG